MKKTQNIFIVGIILIVSPLLLFIIRFWNLGISDKPKDWIDFGTMYYGMIGLLLTGSIALIVHQLNIRNARIGLQFEAYKELVKILTGLTDYIKPMNKTNKEIDVKICETLTSLHHFEENFTFLFEGFDRMNFHKYEQEIIELLNDFRKLPNENIFGSEGIHGSTIINNTNRLLFEIQKIMK